MSVKLTAAQSEIAKDTHRFKVVNAGRRAGKTILACAELVGRAGYHANYRAAYISPTYQSSRDIAWDELKRQSEGVAKDINESRLEITLINGSKIVLRGWESVETLRGQHFDFIVIDEVAMMRRFENIWQEVLRPTLTDTRGEAMFISTPKGYDHFYNLCLMELKSKEYKTFHFTSFDNPNVPAEEIEQARLELTPDAFAQEYLAEFRKVEGLVCPWFNRDTHLNVWPEDGMELFHSVDGGWQDPTAYLQIGVDQLGSIHVLDGFREQYLSYDDIADRKDDLGRDITQGYSDSDDQRMIKELNSRGFGVVQVVKNVKGQESWDQLLANVMDKYGRINEIGNPSLYINPKLEWLIQELETLVWKETKDLEELPRWDDHRRYGHHYDGVRALAYFLVMYEKTGGGVVKPVSRKPSTTDDIIKASIDSSHRKRRGSRTYQNHPYT